MEINMFIPNKIWLEIGDTVELTRDMVVRAGTFQAGTIMVADWYNERGFSFIDSEGNRLTETGLSQGFYKIIKKVAEK
jgi:hypothetical protein